MKWLSRPLVLAAFGVLLTAAIVAVATPFVEAGSRPAQSPSGGMAGAPTLGVSLTWNTFFGGMYFDEGRDIAVDGNGNIYVAGWSDATWGAPIRPMSGFPDAFVAKLDGSGTLLWSTFLGGAGGDGGLGIAVDANGRVSVVGSSSASWGAPIRPFEGLSSVFVAQLDANGALLWNTFLPMKGDLVGYYTSYFGYGIAAGANGAVLVTGAANLTWGDPIRPWAGNAGYTNDAFVAKLDANGALLWNTFLGGPGDDYGNGIVVDGGGDVSVIGQSWGTWGDPIRPYAGGWDAFVARLDPNGVLQWNTFLGGAGADYEYGSDYGIAVDAGGSLYLTGSSFGTWGDPIRPWDGKTSDAFVASLDTNGTLTWNTFLGGAAWDRGTAIAVGAGGTLSVAGWSSGTWGDPRRAFAGGYDAFVAKLDTSGALLWNVFLGGVIYNYYGSGYDYGYGIAVDASDNAFVAGTSGGMWGDPIRVFNRLSGSSPDAFVASIPANPSAGEAVLVSPQGVSGRNAPQFVWRAVPGAAWYCLWVDDSTGTRVNEWLTAAAAHCPTGREDCWASPAVRLARGKATWWIQTWNAAGYGPWSGGMSFRAK